MLTTPPPCFSNICRFPSAFAAFAMKPWAIKGTQSCRLALSSVLVVGTAAVPGAVFAAGPIGTMVAPPGAVLIGPGMDIQAAVDTHPPGSTYFLSAGLYRLQQIVPKDGDHFIGALNARLNGARLLTGATRLDGPYVFDNLTPDPHVVRWGYCEAEFPRCDRPQALFFDDHPLRAVDRLSDVQPGTWFFDYDAKRVYVADNPEGHKVELTDRPFAFGGNAKNVQIENLIVEKYASADQHGAINDAGGGTGWMIVRNEVRQNYGYGITLASGHRAIDNYVHDNGEIGIGGGQSSDILVQGNEIAFNVWNGTACKWECGGAKWGAVSDMVVRGNYVHDNAGDGLWTDESCKHVVYEDNRIENNAGAGISHEISFAAVIRNNVLRSNGSGKFRWGWDSQIQVQNSSDTEVYGNVIELDPARGGNGITVIQQNRGEAFPVHDVVVHDNIVIMRGGRGILAGWFADYDESGFRRGNNHFDSNKYFYPSSDSGKRWFANAPVLFPAWQAGGADPNGLATTDFSDLPETAVPVSR
jgi:hypothetical protein